MYNIKGSLETILEEFSPALRELNQGIYKKSQISLISKVEQNVDWEYDFITKESIEVILRELVRNSIEAVTGVRYSVLKDMGKRFAPYKSMLQSMVAGSKVRIYMSQAKGNVFDIVVKDNGKGLPVNYEFIPMERWVSRKYPGEWESTGKGATLIKHNLRRFDGIIWYKRRKQGTIVYVGLNL